MRSRFAKISVELLNALRPTVAVAWFVTFAALALRQYPERRRKLRTDGSHGDRLEMFVQEVRRFYPFFPVVGGRVVVCEWSAFRIVRR
jgi:fatty-acid peroxygenase